VARGYDGDTTITRPRLAWPRALVGVALNEADLFRTGKRYRPLLSISALGVVDCNHTGLLFTFLI
jgi:hypothetical protein